MNDEACCTCATLLSSIPPTYDEKTEKPARYERRLECCGRAICARCITDNPRFQNYCPFCQISTTPTALPQGLRDPPPYEASPSINANDTLRVNGDSLDELPAYSAGSIQPPVSEKDQSHGAVQDVLHFVDAEHDTILNLSFRYGVPIAALRKTNSLYADHLLAARRTILIPGEYYKGGVSLSPRPLEGEEEEIRRNKIRKWMVACKVSEYDVALLYLSQADYDLATAIQAYRDDEQWEKDHPLQAAKRGKAKAPSAATRLKWGSRGSRT